MMKWRHLLNLAHKRDVLLPFSPAFTKEKGWAWYHTAVYSPIPLSMWRKWSKGGKHRKDNPWRNFCSSIGSGIAYSDNKKQFRSSSLPLAGGNTESFPNFVIFSAKLFWESLPSMGPPKEQSQKPQTIEVQTHVPHGVLGLIPGLILRIHQQR